MNRFIIQVNRCNEWRKVTTVPFDPTRDRPLRRGDHVVHNRQTALREAMRALTAWAGYFSEDLRIVESEGYYGRVKVIGGKS
jgi:hypothetical protein